MVRESVAPDKDEETARYRAEKLGGKREKRDEARERILDLSSKEKPIAYSEMQKRVERGEDEDTALVEGAKAVESRSPEVERDLKKGHERGRPEGET